MKSTVLRRSSFLAAAIAGLCAPVAAEDIDLFTSTGSNAQNPNVVIMIDNSANWDANNQHWPGNVKQGQSELRALRQVVNEVADNSLNLGLMLFTPGPGTTPDGAYVRFHVRGMNTTVRAARTALVIGLYSHRIFTVPLCHNTPVVTQIDGQNPSRVPRRRFAPGDLETPF